MAVWLRIALVELDLWILVVSLALTAVATLVSGERPPPRPRPFYLTDESLWQEWREDTVPIWTVFVAGYVVLAAVIYMWELDLALRVRKVSPNRARRTALRFALGIWTATMISVCLTEFSKGYVGRLRPNYAERCFGKGVLDVHVDADGRRRVDDSACVGNGFVDGRRSFPSGHSSLAAGIGAYFQLWAGRLPGIAPYVSSLLIMTAALWVCASRVVDGAHHVSDIVGGALLGIWFSVMHFWMVERETALAERRERVELENKHG